jgi:2-polyprenyl-6-methoxyphenol hydroxylase-like FAD-dependent oxidoreductase
MHDLIILGGGPAGLTATVYALRKRLDVLLITRDLGGKTNYRLQLPFVEKHLVINGEDIVGRFASEIEYLEFSRVFDKAETVEKTRGGYEVKTRDGKTYKAKALIVATGALGRLLGVPGEKEFMNRGLCYSAVSYAPLFIERETAVIGDGASHRPASATRTPARSPSWHRRMASWIRPWAGKCKTRAIWKCSRASEWRPSWATRTPGSWSSAGPKRSAKSRPMPSSWRSTSSRNRNS